MNEICRYDGEQVNRESHCYKMTISFCSQDKLLRASPV